MDPITYLTEHSVQDFPQELVDTNHWLLWEPLWSDPKEKFLKVPIISAWQQSRQLFSSLPSPIPSGHGYGFIFSAEHSFVCIDVDDGSPLNFRLVQALDSYAEWSPSRKGAHVIVQTDDKAAVIAAFGNIVHNTQEKRDLFISSGYCTITGRRLPVFQDTSVRLIPHEELISILSPYFTHRTAEQQHKLLSFPKQKTVPQTYSDSLVINTLLALPVKYLPDNAFTDFPLLNLEDPDPPEARTPWLVIGQALHSLDNGNMNHLTMWMSWSQHGDKFDKDAIMACWRSFGTAPTEITFATVLKLYYAQRPQFIDIIDRPPKPPRPMPTMRNVLAFINYAKIRCRHNLVTNDVEIALPDKYKPLLPVVTVKATALLVDSEMHMYGTRSGSIHATARELLVAHAINNPYSPIQEYFDSLEHWDYKTRIPLLLSTASFDPANIETYATYLRKWLIQVMAAVYTSHQKPNRLNSVLILQGEQGVGKTRWVESLFPEGLREYCVGSKTVNMSQFRSDQVKLNMELTNTLICNINEIDTAFNPRTYSEFKQFLDSTTDRIVLPYGASSTAMLRRTVFIGSTNKHQIFSDHTGNRRFWLMNAESFDADHKINLNQLWAEARYLYMAGESWWIEDKKILAAQQQANANALRTLNEFLVDKLNNMFDHTDTNITHWEIYTFPRITTLLGLSLRPNSEDFRLTKRTIMQWLATIAPGHDLVKQPKAQGTAWKCKMPPLKLTNTDDYDEW